MPAAPDFRLYHGNDLEILAGLLAAELARSPAASPLVPDTILIPQPAMRRWLQATLAEAHGVAANLRFLTPGEFVREALAANLPAAEDAAGADPRALAWRLWALLADPELSREPVFAPLRAYLDAPDRALRAWSLAGELAAVFEKYQAWRRDWLVEWDAGGAPRDWQAELWRRAMRGRGHRAARLHAYLSRFEEAVAAPQGLPSRLFVFACLNVSPDVLRVIATQARAGTLHFYFPSPVEGWWGDLRTVRERLRDAPATAQADAENPLLEACGAAGRDFVRTLFGYDVVHPGYEHAVYEAPDPQTRPGLLHRLQRELLARRPPGASRAPAPDPADRSLQIHACHTRLREVQVLHDRLRDLLEQAPDRQPPIEPRQIAVLAPDIDAYAPYIEAVFGGAAGTPRFIPYAVADGSALAGSPLVEWFLWLLGLPQARLGANEILDVLALPAIAGHFGLDRGALDDLRLWLGEAGARWGLDDAHRARHGAPAERAYTWQFAIERLLLGHALGDDSDVAGVAPWPDLEGQRLAALDALLRLLRVLARLERQFAQARPAAEWQALLCGALADLLPAQPAEPADQRALAQLREAVAAFGRTTEAGGLSAPLPPEVVRAHFAAALAEPDARQPFLTGGVTFARMVPMRLIPFRVIGLLGMNDGDYPRRDPAGALNRLAAELATPRRRVGDRSLREDDRFLFLQLLASAGDVFYLSYLGADPRDGETLQPSVLVSELLDVAAQAFADPAAARRALVIEHPLQAFAPQAFGADDARRFSYAAEWHPAALAGPGACASLPVFAATALAPAAREEIVAIEDLRRTLLRPAERFLRARLDLRLPEPRERLPENEPFDADRLRQYGIKQRVFAALVADGAAADHAAVRARLLAEGRLAPGAAGEEEFETLLAEVAPTALRFRAWRQGEPARLPVDLTLDGRHLRGSLGDAYPQGLARVRLGAWHGRYVLDQALDRLLLSALGDPRPLVRFLRGAEPDVQPPFERERALAGLRRLLAIYDEAQETPLPFAPRAGYEWFVHRDQPARAWSEAAKAWRDREAHGEGDDPWVRLALRGNDPFDDADGESARRFRALSERIFGALLSEPATEADA